MSTTPDNIEKPARPSAEGVLMHPRALWSHAHIALYSSYEYTYVVNVITALPDFPRPIRAVNDRSKARYIAGDVMAWFEARQERAN